MCGNKSAESAPLFLMMHSYLNAVLVSELTGSGWHRNLYHAVINTQKHDNKNQQDDNKTFTRYKVTAVHSQK